MIETRPVLDSIPKLLETRISLPNRTPRAIPTIMEGYGQHIGNGDFLGLGEERFVTRYFTLQHA
jgi:hypothetical protein